jgi:hypothetical protein
VVGFSAQYVPIAINLFFFKLEKNRKKVENLENIRKKRKKKGEKK